MAKALAPILEFVAASSRIVKALMLSGRVINKTIRQSSMMSART